MIPHLAWSVISTVKTNFIIWETRDWSWKPANFSTKPLAETQWKRADTFKSTEALRKHETMPPFSSYPFPVETVLRKRNGILNDQVSATFPNFLNSLCLTACLLCCLLMSFVFACFVVRHLCRSGCGQNYYLPPSIFFFPINNSLFNTSDSYLKSVRA